MTKPRINPETESLFDDDEIENQDPLGEEAFDAAGFEDAPDGGPQLEARRLEDDSVNKKPGKGGQKIAGVPERDQHRANSASQQRPDSSGVVIRERGGDWKGDPAAGGTRPD
ncbi:MAG TPA: hypothetical protein VFI91_03045 [Longimicrobiaceae bacterium]|nr:hypothetical protein [Longimicrobiaceae bacterium]